MRTVSTPAADTPAGRVVPRPGGPGPSKLRYRLTRAWAKPAVRNVAMVYLPLALVGLIGWRLAADDQIRMAVEVRATQIAERFAARPEFAVKGVQVRGASAGLRDAVVETVALAPGTSSLKLDLEAIRRNVEALGPVKSARVRLDPHGLLKVGVTERVARALWRNEAGGLVLIDAEGVIIGVVGERGDRADLPLILGEGARGRTAEVLGLIEAAPSLLPRIRAFVRVGQRRWDVVLARDVIVMLPERDAEEALARVIGLHIGEDLLDRDLAAIDMRLEGRPTLRLTPGALELYRLHKVAAAEAGEDT